MPEFFEKIESKTCGRCRADKPMNCFNKSRNKLHGWCKFCRKESRDLKNLELANYKIEFTDHEKQLLTKTCSLCNEEKSISEFYGENVKTGKISSGCKECLKKSQRTVKFLERQRKRSTVIRRDKPERRMWYAAKTRSSQEGVPFSISVSDIVIPDFCPVLGIKLKPGVGRPYCESPSLDKIIPGLGYSVGNVAVISHRANMLKSNGTVEEFLAIVDYINKKAAQSV